LEYNIGVHMITLDKMGDSQSPVMIR